MSKLDTIKYQGNDYATVPVRLKEFREKNQRSAIVTTPIFGEDGSLTFKAEIVVDKADDASATATGHAHYSAKEMASRKAFEKLETVATGRALSLLGYLNNGEVASTEEMRKFNEYQEERKREVILSAITSLDSAKTINALKDIWQGLTAELRASEEVLEAKNTRKAALDENN